jgi:hypothetical protein
MSAAARCVHGLDSRFCSICNKRSAASRPRGAIADTTLEEILRFLNDEHVRATSGAVRDVLGVVPVSMGDTLGELHVDASEIITSGAVLAMRMSSWKAKRKG